MGLALEHALARWQDEDARIAYHLTNLCTSQLSSSEAGKRVQWVRDMRKLLSPPEMIKADGIVNQDFFKPKKVPPYQHILCEMPTSKLAEHAILPPMMCYVLDDRAPMTHTYSVDALSSICIQLSRRTEVSGAPVSVSVR